MRSKGNTTSAQVDAYVAKSKRWPAEVARLRELLLDCGLSEALKWGKPCYAQDGNNIAIIQEFKGFAALLFFKGALLRDPGGLLESQGENTRSALRVCFTSVAQVDAREADLRDFVRQAGEVAKAGLTLPEPPELVLAPELKARLDAEPALAAAFAALTPGRQREYNLHISGAKKSETRARRLEGCEAAILDGKGLRD